MCPTERGANFSLRTWDQGSLCPGFGLKNVSTRLVPEQVDYFAVQRNFRFQIIHEMVSDCIIEELNYFATDVSIAHDDEKIEAHKMLDASWYRYRHPATDSGILIQIQAI